MSGRTRAGRPRAAPGRNRRAHRRYGAKPEGHLVPAGVRRDALIDREAASGGAQPEAGLIARSVFELLRADALFCADVATADQYAALQGVSTAKLTGREAFWLDGHKAPIIGPETPAAWGGSQEERQNGERLDAWTRHVGRALWGDEPQ